MNTHFPSIFYWIGCFLPMLLIYLSKLYLCNCVNLFLVPLLYSLGVQSILNEYIQIKSWIFSQWMLYLQFHHQTYYRKLNPFASSSTIFQYISNPQTRIPNILPKLNKTTTQTICLSFSLHYANRTKTCRNQN